MNRRSFTKGLLGGAIALPWLETFASSKLYNNNVRLGWIYMPNGIVPDKFFPKKEGKDYELTPCLQSLEPVKDLVNIHTGCASGVRKDLGHFQAAAFLTDGLRNVANPQAELVAKWGGHDDKIISCDQIASQQLCQNSYLPYMHYSTTSTKSPMEKKPNGSYDEYLRFISWKSGTDYVLYDRDPYVAFNRLFGDSKTAKGQPDELKSILDFAMDDIRKLNRTVAKEDKARLDQYYTSIRSIEKRMANAAKENQNFKLPAGTEKPDKEFIHSLKEQWRTTWNFEKLIALLSDIFVLAYQTNRTKVQTFMYAQEATRQRYAFLGLHNTHHGYSHFQSGKEVEEGFVKLINYQIGLFTRICQKMQNIQEGENTLLDNSLIMLGSGIGHGNSHTNKGVACIVAGKGGGRVKTGQNTIHKNGTRLSNIHLGMLKTAGVKINKFGMATKAII